MESTAHPRQVIPTISGLMLLAAAGLALAGGSPDGATLAAAPPGTASPAGAKSACALAANRPFLEARFAGDRIEVQWATLVPGSWLLLAGSPGTRGSLALAAGADLEGQPHFATFPTPPGWPAGRAIELVLVQRGRADFAAWLASDPVRLTPGGVASPAGGAPNAPFRAHSPFPFAIQSCSLGCSGPVGQIACGVVNVAENHDIALSFSLPVDLLSVSPLSFGIVDVNNGSTPAGTFFLPAGEPRRLVFRPALAFDLQGQPHFGFAPSGSYQIRLPGVSQGDPGPFVRSTSAVPNQHRMHCTITTSGIVDPVPGPPTMSVLVDVVTGYDPTTGLPSSFAYGVPAGGATNVWVDSDITFAFDEIMAPATLLDLVTGQSSTIAVLVDPDGDLGTTADRHPQPGTFSFDFDQLTYTSRLVFAPSPSLPHSGGGSSPLKIVVEVPPTVTDLVGNPLSNPGSLWFVPER